MTYVKVDVEEKKTADRELQREEVGLPSGALQRMKMSMRPDRALSISTPKQPLRNQTLEEEGNLEGSKT